MKKNQLKITDAININLYLLDILLSVSATAKYNKFSRGFEE